MPIISKTAPRRPWEGKPRKAFERSSDKANRDVYDSREWKVLRAMVKEEEPLCRHCLDNGLSVDTYVIDHIQPINQGGAKYDRSNLQGLCEPCHNAKSREESKQAKQSKSILIAQWRR